MSEFHARRRRGRMGRVGVREGWRSPALLLAAYLELNVSRL